MKSIGLDIGTTSISAVVLDAQTNRVEKSWTIANPGFIETEHVWEKIQDADKTIAAAIELLNEILATRTDIAAIGLTGQMHGIVYINEAGKAVSPLITWQDERGNLVGEDGMSVCEAIAKRFQIKAYSGYGLISHLQNIRTNSVPADAVTVATIPDYLGMALTGSLKPVLHSSMAASLGLYNVSTHTWRKDILAAFGEDGRILPRVSTKFEVIGRYRGILVCNAAGDNQASFLGSVTNAKEDVLINIGTGGQLSMLTDHVVEAPEIETRPFNEEAYLAVGSSLCAGRAYAMLAAFMKGCGEAFGGDTSDVYAVMGKLLATPACEHPLKVDTRFAGTREHPEHRGSVSGIYTDNFTPAELVRGVLNGMAQELLDHYYAMNPGLAVKHKRIIASGNGMRRNLYLQQIAAERFGMELALSTQPEEAACGAAMAGLDAVQYRSWKEAVGF